MIGIINYGMGNLGSIQNMLKKLRADSVILDEPGTLENYTKLVLPGVGAFDNGIQHLRANGWVDPLNNLVLVQKVPILGICLGMQLMTKSSEEGVEEGLGWIDAKTLRFDSRGKNMKIPHMGWNVVKPRANDPLFESTFKELRFYHVHSYYVNLANKEEEIASTYYGESFTSAFRKENIWGVQFHPEKSHKFGMQLLKNFNEL